MPGEIGHVADRREHARNQHPVCACQWPTLAEGRRNLRPEVTSAVINDRFLFLRTKEPPRHDPLLWRDAIEGIHAGNATAGCLISRSRGCHVRLPSRRSGRP